MEKIELKGINIELLEELNGTLKRGAIIFQEARQQKKQQEIDTAIEMVKQSIWLKETIRELDIEELKKIDALLYRGIQPSSCTSIKASDLSDRGVNLYVAIVKGVHMLTLKECTYPTEESKNYQKFIQELSEAGSDKTKKFEATSQAMALLRSSASIRENQSTQQQVVTR